MKSAALSVPGQVHSLSDRIIQLILRLGVGEHTLLLAIAGLVGVIAGFSIVFFYRLLDLVTRVVLGLSVTLNLPEPLVIAVLLAFGLVIVRLVVHYGTGDSPGENIPDVMHAVARRNGVLRAWPVAMKTLAAAITIAAGGSVGAEGPVAVLGGGMGSVTGQWFRFRPTRLRLLVGCGAAAGISGAFGAPIAGIFFAMEKILGNFRSSSLAAVVVASVAAAAVTRNVLGAEQVVRIPAEYGILNNSDLVLYGIIGLLGGLVSVLYTRGVWSIGDLMQRFPLWLRLSIAAVFVGLMSGYFEPSLWGQGHQTLEVGMVLSQSAGVLLALSLAKIVATALTLGAGGVGGVFTPAIAVGGAFGGGTGMALTAIFPAAQVQPVACALVGMTAVVAGSAHAPLTAIFIVLELTNDYGLILPLLLAGSLGYVVARRTYPESIYSEWLARRGEHISHGADEAVLKRLTVADAYRSDPITASSHDSLARALPMLRQSAQLEFPVVNPENQLVGIFTWSDLKRALGDTGTLHGTLMRDLASPALEAVTLEDDLLTALRRLGARDAQIIPVLATDDPRRLLGIIGRQDIFAVYERELGE
ncbi:MAG: chloride channel protein [Gemmatimonadales bacterium]